MLIITRRPGQSFMIGDDVKVVVKSVDHNRVCLGFDAPKEVVVDREEIAKAKKRDRPAR